MKKTGYSVKKRKLGMVILIIFLVAISLGVIYFNFVPGVRNGAWDCVGTGEEGLPIINFEKTSTLTTITLKNNLSQTITGVYGKGHGFYSNSQFLLDKNNIFSGEQFDLRVINSINFWSLTGGGIMEVNFGVGDNSVESISINCRVFP